MAIVGFWSLWVRLVSFSVSGSPVPAVEAHQFDQVQPANADGTKQPLKRPGSTADALIVALICAALSLPFLRSIYWLGDEGMWLHGATLLHDGRVLYRDFFEVHPPLVFLITQFWLMFVGHSLAGARILTVLCVAGSAFFTFLICSRVSKSRVTSAALTLIWALSSQGLWPEISHHWLTTLFSLIAFFNLLPNPDGRIRPFLCGFAAAAGAWTTSTSGSFAVFAAFLSILSRNNKVDTWKYLGGVASASALVLLYLVAHGSFYAAYQDIIVFAATRFSDIQPVPFGHATSLQDFAITVMFPAATILAALAMLQSRLRLARDYNFRAAVAFAIAGLLACYPRPDVVHILFAAPLALPLLAISFVQISCSQWQARVATIVFLALISASLLGYYRAVKATVKALPVATGAGKVRFVHAFGEPELLRRIATIGSGQRFLFYPDDPMLSFLTGREHVAPLDVFLPQYTTPAQYADVCVQTMTHTDWVVIDRNLAGSAMRDLYPAITNPQPPEKILFERAIENSFAFAAKYGNYELRKRQKGDVSACANIRAVGQGNITRGSGLRG